MPDGPTEPARGRVTSLAVTIVAAGAPMGRPYLRQGGILSLPRPSLYGAPGPYVYDSTSGRRVPAVARAIQLYAGFAKQMPMEAFRGYARLEPTPRILQRPDPDEGGPWFVQVSVEDYLLNGNALALVTSRGHDGWPLTLMYMPVQWVTVSWDWQTGLRRMPTWASR